MESTEAYRLLSNYKDYLTLQQYRTFKGQIRKGESDNAIKGLERTLARAHKKAEISMYNRCEECKWHKLNRFQKCNCCMENKKLKTRFEF